MFELLLDSLDHHANLPEDFALTPEVAGTSVVEIAFSREHWDIVDATLKYGNIFPR